MDIAGSLWDFIGCNVGIYLPDSLDHSDWARFGSFASYHLRMEFDVRRRGFDQLLAALADRFVDQQIACELLLDADQGQVRAVLFDEGAIQS